MDRSGRLENDIIKIELSNLNVIIVRFKHNNMIEKRDLLLK